MLIDAPESWIGEIVDGYRLTKILGHGKIGYVFLAQHTSISNMLRACKIIREGQLKAGWEREIEKVALLRGIPQIVEILSWGGGVNKASRPYTYINYAYVESKNLRDYLAESGPPSIPIIIAIGEALLRAKHACDAVGIQHGDIHEGNILVTAPDPRLPDAGQRIVVTDFGYGGSHNALVPKDDVLQICSLLCGLLRSAAEDALEATERAIREKLIEFFGKEFTDSYHRDNHLRLANAAASSNSATPNLYGLFTKKIADAKVEAANAGRGVVEAAADDYLNAEALGHRQEEWQNLFVPEILGASAFTSRNVTVITGARGCGKTMAFRRLTLFLDELIGKPSGVAGADGVLGFYLNCRDIIEAFPYIPPKFAEGKRRQVLHFFHLCWLHEILRAFGQRDLRESTDYAWLLAWFEIIFGEEFERPRIAGTDLLTYLSGFVSKKKEDCRLTPLGKQTRWALDRIDLLDNLYSAASSNMPWIKSAPFFFFLDDYTIPLLNEQLQATLNLVIFKRRENLFFKVSTEASNSFLRLMGKKPLEVNHDFDLVDLANETLHVDEVDKTQLLDSIFKRRVRRIDKLRDSGYGLIEILGSSDWSFNEHARRLRETRGASVPLYYGEKAFVGMWSSDIRSMVQLFNELLRPIRQQEVPQLPIPPLVQQSRYFESGGEFLNLTETVRSAGFWDGESKGGKGPKNFGQRLREIAQAFISICRWELVEQPLMRNQGTEAPKQAFRIEIIDELELSDRVKPYYNGLLRWHVFLPDWRGRSMRGVLTPRIFLNRRLLPYARLSFSKKDSISLTNNEFSMLLSQPKNFEKYWKAKKRSGGLGGGGSKQDRKQRRLDLGSGT